MLLDFLHHVGFVCFVRKLVHVHHLRKRLQVILGQLVEAQVLGCHCLGRIQYRQLGDRH